MNTSAALGWIVDLRLGALQLVTFLATALLAITEMLSLGQCLRRGALIILWFTAACLIVAGARVLAPRRSRFRIRPADPVVVLCAAACIFILGITGCTALISAPNSADAMAYHMPRVVYWAEQGSVRFFPTPYLNQIMLQPFAEYVMLHLYVLSGGDRLVNLVQWIALAISVLAASFVAYLFGAAPRGQAIAALFCATLPSGILASSGAKNDYVLAAWMLIAVCFAMRFASTCGIADALFLGAALGFALLTKATAYLFLPWIVCAVLVVRCRPGVSNIRWKRAAAATGAALLCALAINTPHYIRNYRLSGSIMGFDSAQANGFFRWRNETFGWKQTASNVVRNLSEQLGARSDAWNAKVYDAALAIHRAIGIDPNDSATTWRWEKFRPPRNANHEADAPNRVHLFVLFAIAIVLAWRAGRGRDCEQALYMAALVCGFIAFCVYLKWQPFMARLFLPLFVAAAPLTGVVVEIRARAMALVVQVALCVFLLDTARRPLFQNWTRPLTGTASILRVSRGEQYFADMKPWDNRESYIASADLIAGSGCDVVGIDINNLQLEYPLMALVRERRQSTRFLHTAVTNPSRSLPPSVGNPPCAVVCLDCAGDTARTNLYKQFAHAATFGKFVVFLEH